MSAGSTLLKHFVRYVAAKISLYLANEHINHYNGFKLY